MPAGPNVVSNITYTDRQEGVISSYDILALSLSEEETQQFLGSRITTSEKYWNTHLDLDSVRERNENYWRSKSMDYTQLYDFQVPYNDPRIFTSVESLIPMALATNPQPLIQQAADTEASYELAQNLEKVLLAKAEDLYLLGKFQSVARHLVIGKRIAFMKMRWDMSLGRMKKDGSRAGDIAVDVPRPERVVLNEGANDKDNIPLIAEYLTSTIEELCYKYPNKQYDIYKEFGLTRAVPNNISRRVGYIETWFTYFDKQGKPQEGLAWKLDHCILGRMKNPNWNYTEFTKDVAGNDVPSNFFDKPLKPYIIFNHLNTGKFVIDDTSLTEQAAILQDVLNKRGRQIVENADQANGGTIYNSDMISQEAVASLIGDPNEKAMVKGDVTKAAARLPMNQLGEYVIQDKQDARSAIDNVFGTHDPLRGEESGNKTLGQDILSQRSDISRIKPLATAIEDGGDRLYKYMVQMFKVFYDEAIDVQYLSPDGKTSFIPFSQDSIEEGMGVRVKSGSVIPDDPMALEQQTIQTMAILDPLSIAEGLNKPNPKEWAKRLFYFRAAPDKYASEILGIDPVMDGVDPSAAQEDAMLANGQEVPPQMSPTKAHLATHQAFIQSAQFQALSPIIQQNILRVVKMENNAVKQALGQPVEDESQENPQEEAAENPQQEQQEPPIPQAGGNAGTPAATPQPPAAPTNNVMPPGVAGAVKQIIGV